MGWRGLAGRSRCRGKNSSCFQRSPTGTTEIISTLSVSVTPTNCAEILAVGQSVRILDLPLYPEDITLSFHLTPCWEAPGP